MLFKLVLTFIAAAHCLPTGYNKHAKSAERLHALEKELDALKHVAEPQMERRGTCRKECEDAFGKTDHFFLKWVEAKYGPCPKCWDEMGDDKILKLSKWFHNSKTCTTRRGWYIMESRARWKTFCIAKRSARPWRPTTTGRCKLPGKTTSELAPELP